MTAIDICVCSYCWDLVTRNTLPLLPPLSEKDVMEARTLCPSGSLSGGPWGICLVFIVSKQTGLMKKETSLWLVDLENLTHKEAEMLAHFFPWCPFVPDHGAGAPAASGVSFLCPVPPLCSLLCSLHSPRPSQMPRAGSLLVDDRPQAEVWPFLPTKAAPCLMESLSHTLPYLSVLSTTDEALSCMISLL